MPVCECSVTLKNSGTLGCMPIQDVARRLIIVPIYDSSNALNRIDTSSIPTNTQILALINNSDDKARFYPLPLMENVTNERADPIIQSFPSGKNIKVRDGEKTFTGQLLLLGADYAGQIEGYGCAEVGAYIVDAQGNLIGDKSVTGYLSPIRIDKATWDVRTVDTKDQEVAYIQLGFQWKSSVKDSDIGMLMYSDFASDVDWLDYNGLIDLYGTGGASSAATDLSITITTLFGSVANPKVVTNLDTATDGSGDFTLYNVTTTSTLAMGTDVTAIVEDPAGTYTFTLANQTSSDVVSVRIASGTNGYDDTNLSASTVTLG